MNILVVPRTFCGFMYVDGVCLVLFDVNNFLWICCCGLFMWICYCRRNTIKTGRWIFMDECV